MAARTRFPDESTWPGDRLGFLFPLLFHMCCPKCVSPGRATMSSFWRRSTPFSPHSSFPSAKQKSFDGRPSLVSAHAPTLSTVVRSPRTKRGWHRWDPPLQVKPNNDSCRIVPRVESCFAPLPSLPTASPSMHPPTDAHVICLTQALGSVFCSSLIRVTMDTVKVVSSFLTWPIIHRPA